ncbi:uncharacterized protein LOC143860906 isoform X2 [Tasmannia lanceolata]
MTRYIKKLKACIKEFQKELKSANIREFEIVAQMTKKKAEVNDLNEEIKKKMEECKALRLCISELEKKLEGTTEHKEDIDGKNEETAAILNTQGARLVELEALYKEEQVLRKRYFNTIEDMKGKIRVYCRLRPLSEKEIADQERSILTSIDEYTVEHPWKDDKPKQHFYDHVFDSDASQEDVFEDTKYLVQSAVDGYNVCIFAHGQTGSGKTFTIYGSESNPGLTTRASQELFKILRRDCNKFSFSLKAYIIELHQDTLVDLLLPKNSNRMKLEIKKDSKGMVSVENVTVVPISSHEHLASTILRGSEQRHTSGTWMNEKSSGSHLILSIVIETTNLQTQSLSRGKLMILVDDAGGILPAINHSPWNGVTLADFVMPFFLFIVGVSLALAYKKLSNKVVATRKAVLRALKLLIIGLFLQGGYFHGLKDLTYGVDIASIRWMGILQRIAIAFLVAAVCEIWLKGDGDVTSGSSLLKKYQFQLLVASILTTIYMVLLYGLYVPDWKYQVPSGSSTDASKTILVECGVRGDTGPACNAVGMIDRKVFGIQHLYKRPIYARAKECSINSPDYGPLPADAPSWCQAPFDPEGLLSSVMAIVTCLIGLHFGHIIIHFKYHKDRILQWMIPSFCLAFLGFSLDFFGIHVNKVLYTFSYTCVTAGAAGILFTGIYVLVDVYGYRRPTMVLEWLGMHALMIYILIACNILPVILQGFYWRNPQNNILSLIGIGS